MAIGQFHPGWVSLTDQRFLSFHINKNAKSFTFSSVNFGPPDTNRYILIVVPCYFSSNPGNPSCTIGGVSATTLVWGGNTNWANGAQFYAKVPSGWTGNIVISVSSGWFSCCAIGVYRLVNVKTVPTSGYHTKFTGSSTSGSVSMPANSAVFASMIVQNGTAVSWTGVTEDGSGRENSHFASVASYYSPTAVTRTVGASITGSGYKRITRSVWQFN